MLKPEPIVLERDGVRLEPLSESHADGLVEAASDGRLWDVWYLTVPRPDGVHAYIESALKAREEGSRIAWAVRDVPSGKIVGTTSYHDIKLEVDRVMIGYTFYAKRVQRTHVNTACKLLLLEYAFDRLGCKAVGLQTDNFNFQSQRAIEALGAKRDGVIRHHQRRRDGSVRDTVMYSILATEWSDVRKGLEGRLLRHSQ
jgi:RimJ/RimL family protein N-acetyltransferase